VAHSIPEKYGHFPAIGWRLSQALKRAVRRWHLLRARVERYDAVVIEREIFNDGTFDIEQRFRRVAPLLVLDVDDAVFLRHPEKFDRLCRMSDLVLAGNRFLRERIEPVNPNVVVVPTCIDAEAYRIKAAGPSPPGRPVVGWMGTTGNLQYLEVAAPALKRLAATCQFELRLIAPGEAPIATLDLEGVHPRFVRWDPRVEIEQLRQFDIGLMPLRADQPWDKYKCGLKLIQYMAVGIPAVASPVGVNGDILAHGLNGYLVADTAAWIDALQPLLVDAGLRARIGRAARARAENDFSIQAWLPRLVDAMQTALSKKGQRH
jgi:glycosyltransferase involved in cell wall biosynthesis